MGKAATQADGARCSPHEVIEDDSQSAAGDMQDEPESLLSLVSGSQLDDGSPAPGKKKNEEGEEEEEEGRSRKRRKEQKEEEEIECVQE